MLADLELIPGFYQNYARLVKEEAMMDALARTNKDLLHTLQSMNPEKESFRYAEGKWSVKEVLIHLMDAERIFAYRALRFSKGDVTNLAGYDENFYMEHSNSAIPIADLIVHSANLRRSTIDLFQGFRAEMLEQVGSANGYQIMVRHLGYVIAGHDQHHLNILKERYLL